MTRVAAALLGDGGRAEDLPNKSWLVAVGVLGTAAAAWVGYRTGVNPSAGPHHVAVPLRLAIIGALIAGGLWAYARRVQRRMGVLLLLAGIYSCVWLLNGTGDALPFSLGVLASGLAPGIFCYLILAHPVGRIESRGARRFIVAGTAFMFVVWSVADVADAQPVVSTPLLSCAPHCPHNTFYLGLPVSRHLLNPLLWVDWLVIVGGTAVLVIRRAHRSSAPLRRLLSPMVTVAIAEAIFILGFALSTFAGLSSARAFGTAYVATSVAIPVAIFIGLADERLFMGRALAQFVTALGKGSDTNAETLMSRVLRDPSLRISYKRAKASGYVNAEGTAVATPAESPGRSITSIPDDVRPLAVVSFDAQLADQERFIQAAGESALLWIEKERLTADLTASLRELEASRRRIAEATDHERRRIERDLHDGAQQRLVGIAVTLALALDALDDDTGECRAMLNKLGGELTETLLELRSLASGVFPPTLMEHGLVEALTSALRQVRSPVEFQAERIGAYPMEVETAVYFTCMEALQNLSKHAGGDPGAVLRIWQNGSHLTFELRDCGDGFDPATARSGSGLQNMRDRLEAVGGQLTVESTLGTGTIVRGQVPAGPEPRARVTRSDDRSAAPSGLPAGAAKRERWTR